MEIVIETSFCTGSFPPGGQESVVSNNLTFYYIIDFNVRSMNKQHLSTLIIRLAAIFGGRFPSSKCSLDKNWEKTFVMRVVRMFPFLGQLIARLIFCALISSIEYFCKCTTIYILFTRLLTFYLISASPIKSVHGTSTTTPPELKNTSSSTQHYLIVRMLHSSYQIWWKSSNVHNNISCKKIFRSPIRDFFSRIIFSFRLFLIFLEDARIRHTQYGVMDDNTVQVLSHVLDVGSGDTSRYIAICKLGAAAFLRSPQPQLKYSDTSPYYHSTDIVLRLS
jgi:hypothetical protein